MNFGYFSKKGSKRHLNWSNDHSSKSLLSVSPNLVVLSSPNPEQQDRSLLPKQLHHFPSGICIHPFSYLPILYLPYFIFSNFALYLFAQMKMPRRHLCSHHRPHRSAGPLWQVSGDSIFSPQFSGGKKGDSIRDLSTRPMIGQRMVNSLPRWTCQR